MKKYTPRGMIQIELQNIRIALMIGRAAARRNNEDISDFPTAFAGLTKISKIVNQLIKNIDEAQYDGMKMQREVDEMLTDKSSKGSEG